MTGRNTGLLLDCHHHAHRYNKKVWLTYVWYADLVCNQRSGSYTGLNDCHLPSRGRKMAKWYTSPSPFWLLSPFNSTMLLTLNASGVRMQGLFQALYASQGVFIPLRLNGMAWAGCLDWHGGYLWEELNQLISIQAQDRRASGSITITSLVDSRFTHRQREEAL